MNSRTKILEALRACTVPDVERDGAPIDATVYADMAGHFRQMVEAVGGRALSAPDPSAVGAVLGQIDAFVEAANVWSLVDGVASRGGDWDQETDPHAIEVLDFCVVPGLFGVAENGAVWVTDREISLRAGLWIAQHVALVVPVKAIVSNMHEAYARLAQPEFQFGVFVSGPSKTADIEQSLVIGAHGPRSLSVVLVGDAES